ncbi:MAG: AbrB/MazE/SpoVT family DNA-binding domain-containing protein [Verrucomicrobiota bacterium]
MGAGLTQKGQITIPKRFRDRFGWDQQTELTFVEEQDGVRIVEVSDKAAATIDAMTKVEWQGPSADELLKITRER